MKTLVVYDSAYGNTEIIAKAIASEIKQSKLVIVSKLKQTDLKNIDLLIVGSPTQGGRPTPGINEFVNNVKKSNLNGLKAATFDTRILAKDQNIGLRLLMKTIGYAAEKIADNLSKAGCEIVAVEGFIVSDKEGPLKKGEEKRAKIWAKNI